jgi:hypothetical protein
VAPRQAPTATRPITTKYKAPSLRWLSTAENLETLEIMPPIDARFFLALTGPVPTFNDEIGLTLHQRYGVPCHATGYVGRAKPTESRNVQTVPITDAAMIV